MLVKLIAKCFWLVNRLICSTLKYKVSNEPSGQALFAFWHGQSFPLFYWARHRKVVLFPVAGWRGEAIAYLAKKYGYQEVRFLEQGTPLERSKNLEKLIEVIQKGYDAVIAVDGPPKPLVYHQAKRGILYLSQKTSIPIVPVGIKPKRKIKLFWRWDRYELPLPFTTVEICFGQSFLASDKITPQELEERILQLSEDFSGDVV